MLCGLWVAKIPRKLALNTVVNVYNSLSRAGETPVVLWLSLQAQWPVLSYFGAVLGSSGRAQFSRLPEALDAVLSCARFPVLVERAPMKIRN